MNPKKIRNIAILGLFLATNFANSQSLLPDVVSSGGNYYGNTSGSLTFTMGEPLIDTYIGVNNILTQGFSQTRLTITHVKTLSGLDFDISLFPNPTADVVKIKTEKSSGLSYSLTDGSGKLLLENKIVGTETEIPFQKFSPATYYISVIEGTKELKKFKIIKN